MPYSRQEWLSLPPGKRGFKTFERYQTWITNRMRNQANERTRQQDARSYLDPIPRDDLRQEVNTTIRSQYDPLFKQLEDSFRRRAEAGGRQISGFTRAFADDMAQIPQRVTGYYNSAIAGQGALTSGLANFIRGEAGDLGAEITGKAELAGAGPQGGQLAALGQGVGNSTYASGMLGIERLLGERAAAETHAATMPAIVALSGQQILRGFQNNLQSQQSERLGELNAQIPGASRELYQALVDREIDKAIALRGFGMDQKRLDAQIAADSAPDLGDDYSYGQQIDDQRQDSNAQRLRRNDLTKYVQTLRTRKGPGGIQRPVPNNTAWQMTLARAYQLFPEERAEAEAMIAWQAGGYLKNPPSAQEEADPTAPPQRKPKPKPKRPKNYTAATPEEAGTSYQKPKPPPKPKDRPTDRPADRIDARLVTQAQGWRRAGASDAEIAYRLRLQGVAQASIPAYLRAIKKG